MAFSGTTLAYVIAIAATPLLARIYGPEPYGLFSVFMILITNVGTFSTLGYTAAFVLPPSEEEFRPLLQLSVIAGVAVTLATLLVFSLAGHRILALFNASALGWAAAWIPAGILLDAMNRIFSSWNTRQREFGRGAVAAASTTATSKVTAFGVITRLTGGRASREVFRVAAITAAVFGAAWAVRALA